MSETTSGGFALQHAMLTVPPVHIPDGHGGAYKTELVIERSPERTIKILWWYADDPRPEPHCHPWDFTSEILHGGYTEDRYRIVDGEIEHDVETHGAGSFNHVPRFVFHNVRDVLPGTVTRLTCGPAVPGNEWCYLDLETGETIPSAMLNVGFVDWSRDLNPHLRTEE